MSPRALRPGGDMRDFLLYDGPMINIRAGYEIIYDSPRPAPKVFMLSVHPSRVPDLVTPDLMRFEPAVPSSQYVDGFGNVCTRVIAPAGPLRVFADFIVRD